MNSSKQKLCSFLFFAATLLATYVCYSYGFTAAFFFDDEPNLAPLGRIQTLNDVYDFIFNGNAGPIGRPISLASFLINFGAWPNDPASFFYSNTLIHLTNACLLYWFCYVLLDQIRMEVPSKHWVCAWMAGLWALHPLHLSASMFAVQRMTLLSATFVLLGLIAYLKARGLPNATKLRLPAMLLSLGGFGALAGLSKENGLLLPVYALVLEYTLLSRGNINPTSWKSRLYPAALWLVPAVGIAYVVIHWGDIRAAYISRPFALEHRLFSESVILWDYVRLTFFPTRSGLNPFKGNEYLATGVDLKVMLAIGAWISVILLASIKRKSWPWFTFGVFWFLACHSMESTVIPLELYFHHRNYLSSAGLLLGSALALSQISPHYRPWVYRTATLIMAGFGFILYQCASVWGNVPLAAALWYEEQPQSERAIQFQARALGTKGDWESTYQLMKRAAEEQPQSSAFKLQQLQTACGIRRGEQLQNIFSQAYSDLDRTYKSPAATDALDKIRQMVINHECDLSLPQVLELHAKLMKNPSFQNDGNLRFELYMIRARIYRHQGELNSMMSDLENAFAIRPSLNLSMIMAYELATAELFDESEYKLKEVEQHLPKNPILRQIWQNEIAKARDGLEAMRAK